MPWFVPREMLVDDRLHGLADRFADGVRQVLLERLGNLGDQLRAECLKLNGLLLGLHEQLAKHALLAHEVATALDVRTQGVQRLILALRREPQYDREDDRAGQPGERHDELGARNVEKRGQSTHRGGGVGHISPEDFTGLLECGNEAEEGQEQPDRDKQGGDLPPHPRFETKVLTVEEDDRSYGVAQDSGVRCRREGSLVELPPRVHQLAIERASRACLSECAVDIDETVPSELAVGLDAKNHSNRPHGTDETPGDDVVPERQPYQRHDQDERHPTGHVFARQRSREGKDEVDDRLPREIFEPCEEINGVHLESAIVGSGAKAVLRAMEVDNDRDFLGDHGSRKARSIEDVSNVDDVASVSTRPDVRAAQPSGPKSARTTRRSRECPRSESGSEAILRGFRKTTVAYRPAQSTLRTPNAG